MLYKNTFKKIKKSLGRYISLLIIVMVGVGFYAGIAAASPNIVRAADRYYKNSQLMFFKIVSSMGLTDEDVAAVKQIGGVEDAFPSYSLDMLCGTDAIRFHAIEKGVNTIRLAEGRMPELANECVADNQKYKLGDIIEITGNEDALIRNNRFTVVGLGESALYLDGYGSTAVGDGKLHSFVFISKANFDLEAYTEIYVAARAEGVFAYSEEYADMMQRLNDEFARLKPDREQARYAEIYDTAMETIGEKEAELLDEKAKAEQELADAKQELDDGARELAEGKINGEWELKDAKRELDDGARKLADGKEYGQKELDDAKKALDEGAQELKDGEATGKKEFAEAWWALWDGRLELQKGKQTGQKELRDAKKELDDGARELQDGKLLAETEFADAKNQLDDGMRELQDGKDAGAKELAAAKAKLDEGAAAIQDGKQELAENEAMLQGLKEEKTAEFDDAKRQIADGWDQIDEGLAEAGIPREQVGGIVEGIDLLMTNMDDLLANLPAGSPVRDMVDSMLGESEDMLGGLKELDDAINTLNEQEAMLNDGIALFDSEMDKAANEIDAAKKELDDGEHQILGGYIEYYKGVAAYTEEIAQGEKKLGEGYAEYNLNRIKYEYEIADGERKLDEGYEKYNDGLAAFNAEIKDGEKKLSDGYKEFNWNLAKFYAEIRKGEKELADGYKEYEDGLASFQAEIEENEQTLRDGYAEYEEGLAEFLAKIEENEQTLYDGYQEYEDGLAEFEAEIADAEVKITDAKLELADLSRPKWYIFDRNAVTGYNDLGSIVNTIAALSAAVPILFILIALFITSNSMARMIAEERGELGALVSLGYGDGKIISAYLLYVLSATGIGALTGYFTGCRFIPPLIYSTFYFNLPPIEMEYNLGTLAIILLFTFTMMSAVTIVNCRKELKQKPACLLRPLPPKNGRKILLERVAFVWRRFSFTWKITIRNMFRYKKRGIMTILGMAGCAALLVLAFGLRDSMNGIAQKQYGDIFTYSAMITLKDDATAIGGELGELLDAEQVQQPLLIRQSGYECEKDGKFMDFYLIVPQSKDLFGQYFKLTSKRSQKEILLDQNSAVVTQRLAKVLKIKPGDSVTIKNADNESFHLTVTDVAENYASEYLYMNPAGYYKIFGETAAFNTIVAGYTGDQARLSKRLTDSGLAVNVTSTDEVFDKITESTESLSGVVVLVAVVASLLAIVVLYNLTSINISERSREIATLKVLGFRDGEANTYIYREALVLSLISIGAGMLLGVVLHSVLLDVVETGAISLHKRILWPSFVLASLMTMFFSFAMQIVTYFKLKKINMIAALKSVD